MSQLTNTEVEPGMESQERGPKAGTPEARKGGLAVRQKYGLDHFAEMGRKGGEVIKARHADNPDHFPEIGRKGGNTTKERHGREFFQEIGKKGGQNGRGKTKNRT